MSNNIYALDVEIFPNLFTVTAISEEEEKAFVVHKSHPVTEIEGLYKFLVSGIRVVGFNIIRFDYPLLNEFLDSVEYINAHPREFYHITESGGDEKIIDYILDRLWVKTSQVLADDYFPPYEYRFPVRDLFTIHHFNNPARATSLKDLESRMGWPTVQEMPIEHGSFISTDEIGDILDYNRNDTAATLEFYKRSKAEIDLRRELGRYYHLDMMNWPNAKIGEQIFLTEISRETGIPTWELRKQRTFRDSIRAGEILLPYINFEQKAFNSVYEDMKALVIDPDNLNKAYKRNVLYDGCKYVFGVGGLHEFRAEGIYPRKGMYLLSCDVKSYYPNLAIVNTFYPRHLGEAFVRVYKRLFAKRSEFPKKSAGNFGLKYALNIPFGKTNDKFSFLYDPQYTVQITLNGQLLLAMLCEMVTKAGGHVVMANTDGIEVMCDQPSIYVVKMAMESWASITGLTLEHSQYSRLAARDVNNYLGEMMETGEIKAKGDYLPVNGKRPPEGRDWNQSFDYPVVIDAVHAFILRGIPVKDFIAQETDVMKFCITKRAKGGAKFSLVGISDKGIDSDEVGKIIRYLVTRSGKSLVKSFNDGRTTVFHKGYRITNFNRVFDIPRHEIFDPFYVREAQKLISPLINVQQSTDFTLQI